MNENDFAIAFKALTGHPPFPWQTALYQHFQAGDFPRSCNLPTGLGKTSVIAIWLIALAAARDRVPRRLVYVVNRRTVVDQTTDEVERLRKKLAFLSTWFDSLALSTLRGQFADNREWSADPSRPAVIVGTVDMIGSRLLFSGYRCGFKTRPLHAGFLGQDALLVHDEAHLEPAFQRLIERIEEEQRHGRSPDFRPLRVMELTATSRGGGETFGLEKEDHNHPEVQKRITAKKTLQLTGNRDEKKLAEEIAQRARDERFQEAAVLVFVHKVEDVEKIIKGLPAGSAEPLTGTLRGLERDALVRTPIFQRFLPASNRDKTVQPAEGTVYLVCTSAGEVGVNISADHLVCDLSTFESMSQRFGRVNRFGLRADSRIDVVHPKSFDEEDEYQVRLSKTLTLLCQLAGDASPAALNRLDPEARLAAFALPPVILPTSDILFDAWALTTIREKLPGRPSVEPYLHGVEDEQRAETYVAWREEVKQIDAGVLDLCDPAELLEDYPLKPLELLRDTTTRVFDRLKKLAAPPETPVWIVEEDGTVRPTTLGEMIAVGREGLAYRTVLLPPGVGGLERGMLRSDTNNGNDVADEWYEGDEEKRRRRVRIWDIDPDFEEKCRGMRLIRPPLDICPDADEREEVPARRFWYWYERPNAGDSDGSRTSQLPVRWQDHTDDVVRNVERLVAELPLPDDVKKAVVLAARFHDLGKRRELWQRSIGNVLPKDPRPEDWLAKSGSGKRLPDLRIPYRHEFGSLLDALEQAEFQALDDKPDLQELVLHLIAVHHGYGRPHFPKDAVYDPEPRGRDVEGMAATVPQRFARLQRRYGRWGLAYLESLLRAADYAASAHPSPYLQEVK